jgi:hypothetical protein
MKLFKLLLLFLMPFSVYGQWQVVNFTMEKELTSMELIYQGYPVGVTIKNFPSSRPLKDIETDFIAKLNTKVAEGKVQYMGKVSVTPLPFKFYKYLSSDGGNSGNYVAIYSLADKDITITHFKVKLKMKEQLNWDEFSKFIQSRWNGIGRLMEQKTFETLSKTK